MGGGGDGTSLLENGRTSSHAPQKLVKGNGGLLAADGSAAGAFGLGNAAGQASKGLIAQYNPKQSKNNRYGEVKQIYNFDYQQPGQPNLSSSAQPALQTIQQPSASTKAHQLGGGAGGAALSQAASA